MSLEILEKLEPGEKCIFCRHNNVDELLYGKIYKIGDIITHYFCMLFSSNMEQNGADEEGILGFLPQDIKKEVARGNKLTCIYCHHAGATIGCFIKACKKKFHYPCGVEHGSLHLFFGQFRSYCYAHRRNQNIPAHAIKLTEKPICVMCQDEVIAKPINSTVWAPCCKIAWLHRKCVQKMAVNAGYFFKCPNCNDKEIFRTEMLNCGIYIPDQDAAWELEPNAFYELTERYSSCDAENCVCPKGREFSEQSLDWEIILCNYCGSQGIHNKCGENLFDNSDQWMCALCLPTSGTSPAIKENPGPSVSTKQTQSRRPQNLRKEPSSSTDSCWRKRSIPTSTEDESDSPPNKQKSELFISSISSLADASNEFNQTVESKYNEIKNLNVVELDSDTDEDDTNKIQSSSNTKDIHNPVCEDDIETKLTCLGLLTNNNKSNKKNIADRNPSIIIDLLDSDDECNSPEPPVSNSTLENKDNISDGIDEEEEDDDVIFVGCDYLEPQSNKDNVSTALIRINNNNQILVTTPTDLKKSTQATFNILPNFDTTNSENSQNFVWQPVPLHKSIINSYQSPQLISSMNPNNNGSANTNSENFGSTTEKNLLINQTDVPIVNHHRAKEITQSDWNFNASEIIDLDD